MTSNCCQTAIVSSQDVWAARRSVRPSVVSSAVPHASTSAVRPASASSKLRIVGYTTAGP